MFSMHCSIGCENLGRHSSQPIKFGFSARYSVTWRAALLCRRHSLIRTPDPATMCRSAKSGAGLHAVGGPAPPAAVAQPQAAPVLHRCWTPGTRQSRYRQDRIPPCCPLMNVFTVGVSIPGCTLYIRGCTEPSAPRMCCLLQRHEMNSFTYCITSQSVLMRHQRYRTWNSAMLAGWQLALRCVRAWCTRGVLKECPHNPVTHRNGKERS